MTLRELEIRLNELHAIMDSGIDGVTDSSVEANLTIYEFLLKYIRTFEQVNERFISTQDMTARMAYVVKRVNEILSDQYLPSVKDYLNTYSTIEETNVNLHKSYNDLLIDLDKVAPARKTIYNQANYYLTKGLADAFVQPVKYLILQQVTGGLSIKDTERILRKWNDGELTGQLTSGRPTPRLQSYTTVIARDSAYQFHGTIQNQIQQEYKLDAGIYTGDIIKDSRPSCTWMIRQQRKILLSEVTAIIGGKIPEGGQEIVNEKEKPFLSGLIPGTNTANFPIYRFGYACRHSWFPVKVRKGN